MSEPFIGEIRTFGFSFAPIGWALCNGQLLSIQQNTPLFAIIGTIYGGDGQSTFAVPNLQGRSPMHWGSNAGVVTIIGEPQGTSAITLTAMQMPVHMHTISAANVPTGASAERSAGPKTNSFLAQTTGATAYVSGKTADTPFNAAAMSSAGSSLPHENMQPYLTINFCIALEGIFPTRS